jgi:hypothetical protein
MSLFKTLRAVVAVAAVTVATETPDASAQGYINPEVYNSGRLVTGARYDPFTGQIVVRTDQTKVRESYLDPNRGQIDPGSYRQVNRYETDVNGVQWHVTGTQWTSFGVPHGNLSRKRVIRHVDGVTEDRNEHVAYDAVPGNKKHTTKPNVSKHQNRFQIPTRPSRRSKPAIGFQGRKGDSPF